MRWTISIVSVLVALVAQPAASGDAVAQLPAQQVAYSAESVVAFGSERLVWKSFHDRGLERHELSVDGLDQITILRPDLNLAYVMQPAAGSLLELPIEDVTLLPPMAALYAYDAKKLGTARVNGEAALRFALTNARELPGPEKLTVWIAEDGVVLQLQGQVAIDGEARKVTLKQQDVIRGAQDPLLFDPLYQAASKSAAAPVSLPETMGKDGP